jgi:phospholipid/cholesterol/gamma-HCH transport system substrate-binding protein
MKNVSTELKVGLFAIIVIVVLSYMTFKVGGLPMIWEKGYRLYAEFDDVSGLDEQSRIKIAGVEAGILEKIRLENGKAKLTLLVQPDVKVYRNAVVSLRMSGLLGDRYLALTAGTPDQPLLKNGDTITETLPAADIDILANRLTSAAANISDLTRNIQDAFGETERESIREAIHNLKAVTLNLKEISAENRVPLRNVIAQLETFTGALEAKGPGVIDDISNVARNLNDKGPEFIDNLNKAAKELKEVIEENRYAFKESMGNIQSVSKSADNIAHKIERGEGTLGKLMTDNTLYNSLTSVSGKVEKSLDFVGRLRTYLDFHSEYNTGESEWKGYFDLTLRPRDDKYYILGIVTDPLGSVKTTETTINGVTETKDEVESRIEFTAQFAKRFDNVALRIGLMENTFGLGADYFFNDENGRMKFDVWDFSAKEAGADDAHARVGLDYRLFKFFFVSGGVDNILNANRRGVYVGGGLKFEDEDLKYLLGSTPNISVR